MAKEMNFLAASGFSATFGTTHPMRYSSTVSSPLGTRGKGNIRYSMFSGAWGAVSLGIHVPHKYIAAFPCTHAFWADGHLFPSYPGASAPEATNSSTERAASRSSGESQALPDLSPAASAKAPGPAYLSANQ